MTYSSIESFCSISSHKFLWKSRPGEYAKRFPVHYRLNVRIDAFISAEELSEVRNILRYIHDKTAWYPVVNAGNFCLMGPDMDGIDDIRSETHRSWHKIPGERVIFDCGCPKPETFARIDAILGRVADIGLTVGAELDVENGNFTFFYFNGPSALQDNGDRGESPRDQYEAMNSMIPRNDEELSASLDRAMKIKRLARTICNEYYGAYDVTELKPLRPEWWKSATIPSIKTERWTDMWTR